MEDKLKIASKYKREDHGLMADANATFDETKTPESERYSEPKVQSLKQDAPKDLLEDNSDNSDNSEVTNIQQDTAASLNQDSLDVGNDLSRQILSETQKQSATMAELSQTMQRMLQMQEKENAPKPKRQLMNTIEEGENAIRYSDYDGTPKGEGAIDQLGSAFGSLLGTIGGLLGGGAALSKLKDIVSNKRNKGTTKTGGGLFGGTKESKPSKPTLRDRISSTVKRVNPFNKVDVKDSPEVDKTNKATPNKKSWFSDLLKSEESPKPNASSTPKKSFMPKGSSVKVRGVAGLALKGAALFGSAYAASGLFGGDTGSNIEEEAKRIKEGRTLPEYSDGGRGSHIFSEAERIRAEQMKQNTDISHYNERVQEIMNEKADTASQNGNPIPNSAYLKDYDYNEQTNRSFVDSPETTNQDHSIKKVTEVKQELNIKGGDSDTSNVEGKVRNGNQTFSNSNNALNSFLSESNNDNLGNTSRKFETNNSNVMGSTYGKYNISANNEMTDFLSSPEGSVYAPYFHDSTPGTANFNARYAKVSGMFPDTMDKAQHAYVDRVKYQPMKASLREDTGLDLNSRGRALNEAVFSTANEYGSESKLIRNALRGEDVTKLTDEQIINLIQKHKKEHADQYETSNVVYLNKHREAFEKAQQRKERAIEEHSHLLNSVKESDTSSIVTNGAPMSVVSKSSQLDNVLVTNSKEDSSVNNFAQSDNALLMAAGVAPIAVGAGALAVKKITSAKQDKIPDVGDIVDTKVRKKPVIKGLGKPPESVPQPKIEHPSKLKGIGKGAGKVLGKAVPMANVALGAMDAYAIINDDTMSKRDKEKALAGVAGGTGGAMAGGAAGASAGAALGSLFFGVGAVPGAILGGLVGSTLGYFGGSTATEAAYDTLNEGDTSFVEKVTQDKQGGWFSNLFGGDESNSTVDASTVTNVPEPTKSEVKKAQSETLRDINNSVPKNSNVVKFESKDRSINNIVGDRNSVNNVSGDKATVNRSYGQETLRSFVDESPVTHASYHASNVTPINSSSVSNITPTNSPTSNVQKTSTVKSNVSSIRTVNDTPAEQAKYDPVKTVRTNEPKIQDTSMPDRSSKGDQRITSRGIGQGNSIRQTIDGCPAVINDAGLVLLQTGFI